MNQATTIVIEFWQLLSALCILVVAFFGVVTRFGRGLMKQFELRLEERFKHRDEKLTQLAMQVDRVEAHGRHLETDLMRLRAELPNEYVGREDWIRFSGTIDTKLDWLRAKIEITGNSVAQLVERWKSRSDNDGG